MSAPTSVSSLWLCPDPFVWFFHYSSSLEFPEAGDVYSRRILQYSMKKSSKSSLPELDEWKRNVFTPALQARLKKNFSSSASAGLDKEEITKLMKWKLNWGTFRPSLMKLIQDNSEENINKITNSVLKKTMEKLSSAPSSIDIPAILKEFNQLRGVGPATASAILSSAFPSVFPYFSDDLLFFLFPGEKNPYSPKIYEKFFDQIEEKAKMWEISIENNAEWNKIFQGFFTPQRIVDIIWSFQHRQEGGGAPEGSGKEEKTEKSTAAKGKRAVEENPASSAAPKKRHRN